MLMGVQAAQARALAGDGQRAELLRRDRDDDRARARLVDI